MLEYEVEIVVGYCIEYSGLKWGMFFLVEYAYLFVFFFVIFIVFFGGFNVWGFIFGGIVILIKVGFFVFLFMWVRVIYLYVRLD